MIAGDAEPAEGEDCSCVSSVGTMQSQCFVVADKS